MQVKAAECVVISLTVNVTANTIHCPGKCEYQIYNFFYEDCDRLPWKFKCQNKSWSSSFIVSLLYQEWRLLFCIVRKPNCNRLGSACYDPSSLEYFNAKSNVEFSLLPDSDLLEQLYIILLFYICKKKQLYNISRSHIGY